MTLDKQTPSEQIAEFVQSHPGDWYIGYGNSRASINLCCDADLVLIAEDDGIRIIIEHGDQSTDLGGVVTKRTVIVRMTRWLCDRIVNGGGYIEMFPVWLHSAIRDALRLNAINLLIISGVSYSILEPIVAMYDTSLEADTDPTTSPEISPDSQAIEQARAVLKAASSPASLPIWQVRIAIVTDAHGVYVVISHDDQPLFTSRHVAIDRLIEAFEDAAQFAEHGMPYDDGGSALMSVRDWISRLSVVSDLRRILGVTV